MQLTKANYAKLIIALSQEQRVSFYESLAHELTIVCRVIWSDQQLSDAEKVEAMKWLNEIQHRIIAKIKVERTQSHVWTEQDVIGMIDATVKQNPNLGANVAWALQTSYEQCLRD